MSLSIPKFIVRKISTALNYTSDPNDCSIDLRVNNPWEATIKFNNSSGLYTGVFSCEDEVALFIDSASAANLIMVGFIDDVIDSKNPNNERIQTIHIVDWVSYYAAKTIYEKDWIGPTVTAKRIIDGEGGVYGGHTIAEISGLTANITGLNTSSEKMPRKFNGTYVKDAWHIVAENSGADFTPSYTVNAGLTIYTKTINFFGHGTRELTYSPGVIWNIRDIVPTTANTLMILHNNPYEFTQSAKYRFTNVTAMTGQVETFPDPLDFWCTAAAAFTRDQNNTGKDISEVFTPFFSTAEPTIDTHWNVNNAGTTLNPFTFTPDETLCGTSSSTPFQKPTMKIHIRNTLSRALTYIGGRSASVTEDLSSAPPAFFKWHLNVTDWQKLGFCIKNALTGGGSVDSALLILSDNTTGTPDFWYRDIYDDIKVTGESRTSWTYLEYSLPANTTVSPSNGWIKSGSPTEINSMVLSFSRGGSDTGYTAGSYIGLSTMHFYRRRRKTVSGSGVLTTEKIIIDSSTKSPKSLEVLATKELARINKIGKTGYFTLPGGSRDSSGVIAFIYPGYEISLNFENTLGSNRKADDSSASYPYARISQIRHYLENGRWFTYIQFEDAFQRI